jgi:hypothetical protein
VPYFYECDTCGGQHAFNPNDTLTHSELPERNCDACGQDGCIDCVSPATGLCSACQDGEDVTIFGEDRDYDYDGLFD